MMFRRSSANDHAGTVLYAFENVVATMVIRHVFVKIRVLKTMMWHGVF